MRIYIFGASGTGTTTLGKVIAQRYNIKHVDSDDVFWHPTEVPYQKIRTNDEQLNELKKQLPSGSSWVLSGSIDLWEDYLKEETTHLFFLTLNDSTRIERIIVRERSRFGKRIDKEGDLYETHLAFINWTKSYFISSTEKSNYDIHLKWYRDFKLAKAMINTDVEVENLMKEVTIIL